MSQKRTYEEAVEITVKWWSEKVFDTLFNQNNGDDSKHGGMAFALMNLISSKAQEKVTPEAKQKFEQKLKEILLSKKGEYQYANTLSVDYHPNRILAEVCAFAGVDESCLPCKTFTRIGENNIINGRYQYGSPFFEL